MVWQSSLFRRSSTCFRPVLLVLAFCLLAGTWTAHGAERREWPQGQGNARAEAISVRELEFKKTRVLDAVRVISELTRVNIVATTAAGEKQITFFIRDLSVTDIVDSLCRIAGLWYRYNSKTGTFIIMTTEEYGRDIVVFRDEPVRAFKLKYLNVGIAARTIADLFGERVQLEGKANRFLGDDYTVGSASGAFAENMDDGTMDDEDESSSSSSSSRNRRSRDRTDSKRGGSAAQQKTDAADLTTARLALLEEMQKRQPQMISESALGQVSKQQQEPTIYVTINRMHNMLFVRTSDEKAMEEIARIIEESDLQVPEVLLEMKVLEVQLNDEFQSAFDISSISGNQKRGPDDGQVTNPFNADATTVGSTAVGSGNFDLIGDSTLVFQALSGNLRVRLQLLEAEGRISSIATPMLLAANNHPAKLFIGQERVMTTGFTTESVDVTEATAEVVRVTSVVVPETEVRSVGDTLSILPSINADRSVVMRIVHEKSSVAENSGKVPVVVGNTLDYATIDSVNTSTLEGTVLAHDGMTVAVGGMMRTTKNDASSKVPVLGDIPLLGFFFREDAKTNVKTELVLLITPHVLSAPSQGEAITRQRLSKLSSHPNEMDLYFDELDKSRETARGAAGGKEIDGLNQSFIELTRVAAKQVRMTLLLRKPEGSVKPVHLPALGEVALFPHKGVRVTPMAAWHNGFHYITALKVENTTRSEVVLDVGTMRGTWNAATLETQQLAPAGREGDFTYLYLISEQPFANTMGLGGK